MLLVMLCLNNYIVSDIYVLILSNVNKLINLKKCWLLLTNSYIKNNLYNMDANNNNNYKLINSYILLLNGGIIIDISTFSAVLLTLFEVLSSGSA